MSRIVLAFKVGRKEYNPALLKISTWASARIDPRDWAWHYWNAVSGRWIIGIEFVNSADAVAFKLIHPTLIIHE